MTDAGPEKQADETEGEDPKVDKSTVEDLDVPAEDADAVEGGMKPSTICSWTSERC
ncbi:MAG: hypothetical protein QOE31_1757 [Solirubrobacteraceae bacterium]|jgi:hypothetical protein|nr:hypothetical protein [Solirubrobacteraceae bacterium]